jgi:hypothetical protein
LLLAATVVNPQSTVTVVTVTWTQTLQTRQNWQNHLPNKTTVRKAIFSPLSKNESRLIIFRIDSSMKYFTRFCIALSLSLSLSHDMTSPTMLNSNEEFSAGERTAGVGVKLFIKFTIDDLLQIRE